MRSVKAIGGVLLAGCLGLAVLWAALAGCGPTQETLAPAGGAAAAGAGAALADKPPGAPGAAAPAPDAQPPTQTKFSPTWDSLKRYEVPAWFRDAKFGIWAHWSAQCVPEEGDWYARGMYEEGSGQYKYHVEHYGHPSKVGFKDICNLWKAEKWDPDRLIALYKRAGAKYFVALANHHCNFDCWDSKFQPWNSVAVGPKKDIVGLWAKAARKQGLRFGVTVHCARAWDWYDVAQGADKQGPLAGVPYDGALTKADGKGAWWEGLDPADLYAPHGAARTPEARKAYIDKFYNRVIDLVDSYRPDLLYFDDGVLPLNGESDAGLRIAAHYYNASTAWHEGRNEAVMNTKGLGPEERRALVWDIERGRADRIEPFVWQTDTCIGEWHYHRGIGYKSAATVIAMLADIVSKNGNLLLNIPVRGDGTIDEREEKVLEDLAAWMQVNAEAIFATRPWLVFGEGRTRGSTGDSAGGLTARDLRFTTKGDALYAIVLGWPADGRVAVRSLAKVPGAAGKIAAVTLLGHAGALAFTHDEKGLAVTMPEKKPCETAWVLKITGQGLREFRPDLAPDLGETIEPGPDGSVVLPAELADMHGDQVHVEERQGRPNIGFWDRAGDWVSWKVKFPGAGAYEVTAECAAAVGETALVVEIAGQSPSAAVAGTGSWDDYAEVKFGRVEVKEAGTLVVKVRPRDPNAWKPVNLRAVRLRKAD